MLAATSSACDTPPCRATEQDFRRGKSCEKIAPGQTELRRLSQICCRESATPRWVEPNSLFVPSDAEPVKRATKQQIREEIRILYDEKKNEGKKIPNINETKNEVFNRLAERDLEAKKNA